jgi:hypothetical protein
MHRMGMRTLPGLWDETNAIGTHERMVDHERNAVDVVRLE